MELATGAAQARGIYQVALALKYFINVLAAGGNVESSSDDEKVRFAGLSFSFVVLRALSAELALKVLYTRRTGDDAARTHDLFQLWQTLPGSTRNAISQKFQSRQTKKSVEDVFADHKDDFIAWRYAYQDPNLHTDFGDLETAVEVVLEELGV